MSGDSANAYNQYRKIAVTTARPEKLLIMLYDGLVIDLKQAKQAIERHDPATAHTYLLKGQNIITQLMATLKMEYRGLVQSLPALRLPETAPDPGQRQERRGHRRRGAGYCDRATRILGGCRRTGPGG